MKNLITAMASLLLLSIFVVQFAGNQVIHTRLFRADMAVESFRDMAKEQGCITAENETYLKERLTRILDCRAEQIWIEGTREQRPKGEILFYKVKFPLEHIVMANRILGIEDEENMAWFEDEGWVVSRYKAGNFEGEVSP
ncbi:MAG: hypothetical protein HFE73_02720 [Firmicutes bacterium]|nr:hypothetical protein [Bacillota bacterium]